MPVKVMGSDGSGRDFDIAEGIRWAADHGAQVINLSLGGPQAGTVLADAVSYAASKDCVLVAAGGNENAPRVDYPAGYTNCIAVGAVPKSRRWIRQPEVSMKVTRGSVRFSVKPRTSL